MFRGLFLLFVIMPIIEIALIMEVGALLGGWTTVALVILSAWIGAKLVREQGISTLSTIQEKLAKGEMPSDEVTSGLMILVSGVLMVTPGFVTDGIGLFLLWPTGRKMLAKFVKENVLAGRVQTQSFGQGGFYHYQSQQHHQHSPHAQGQTFEHEGEQAKPQQHEPKAIQGNVIEGDYERKE